RIRAVSPLLADIRLGISGTALVAGFRLLPRGRAPHRASIPLPNYWRPRALGSHSAIGFNLWNGKANTLSFGAPPRRFSASHVSWYVSFRTVLNAIRQAIEHPPSVEFPTVKRLKPLSPTPMT